MKVQALLDMLTAVKEQVGDVEIYFWHDNHPADSRYFDIDPYSSDSVTKDATFHQNPVNGNVHIEIYNPPELHKSR